MSKEELLGTALAAADRGWHVFPLRPGGKRPAFPNHTADRCSGRDARCRAAGAHVGWEPRATTDPDRIRRAWSTAPYNLGIACGPSGLIVIDCDQPKPETVRPNDWAIDGVNDGADVLAVIADRHGQPLPLNTHTVQTGRGGLHLYFTHPATGPSLRNTTGGTQGSVGWLVDTRAHGGYVVAAGSVVAGRPYVTTHDAQAEPLPDWLADLLTPRALPPQRPVIVDLAERRRTGYLDAAITAECQRVTTAPAGSRNRALYLAAVALGQLAAGGALTETEVVGVLTPAAESAGLRPAEISRTITSGLRAGRGRPRKVAA